MEYEVLRTEYLYTQIMVLFYRRTLFHTTSLFHSSYTVLSSNKGQVASRTFPELPQTARLEAGGVPRDQPVISEFSLVHPGPCPMAGLGKRGWWDQQAY